MKEERSHAVLSASSSHKWLICPPSARLEEKFPNKNIWCYTGFDFEKDVMGTMAKNSETTRELLKYIDIVVDGKFEEEKKDLKLQFRGSSNQRILNVKETLKTGELKKEEKYR